MAFKMRSSPAKGIKSADKYMSHNKAARKTEGSRFRQWFRSKFGSNKPK